jgi:hypothetical protein
MKLPTIPRNMANQSVVLRLIKSRDQWNDPDYTDPQTIEYCVVQPQTIYAGDNNNRKITANAIVYFYAQITKPMPVLTPDCVGAKVTFEGKDYVVTNFVDNRDPFSNDVWSYELEVL